VEIEDQQYPCSNKDQLSLRLIQAVLIPSYLPLVVGCVHKMEKADMSMEPKLLGKCSKIFIFQPILEFQKHFRYTEANAVKLSTFQ
jgi:hypothetical protein